MKIEMKSKMTKKKIPKPVEVLRMLGRILVLRMTKSYIVASFKICVLKNSEHFLDKLVLSDLYFLVFVHLFIFCFADEKKTSQNIISALINCV